MSLVKRRGEATSRWGGRLARPGASFERGDPSLKVNRASLSWMRPSLKPNDAPLLLGDERPARMKASASARDTGPLVQPGRHIAGGWAH